MAGIEKDKKVLEMTLSEKEVEKEKCMKLFQEQIVVNYFIIYVIIFTLKNFLIEM